jgi:hypothetical protein
MLRNWKFCRRLNCPDRNSAPILQNDLFARRWLYRHKDDTFKMNSMRTLLLRGFQKDVFRMSDEMVVDEIVKLLAAGTVHIHPVAAPFDADGQGSGEQAEPKKDRWHSEPCYGCVTNTRISNIVAFNKGGFFGHHFDFTIDMNFIAGTDDVFDCTLEWWEKSNIPSKPEVARADQWVDMVPYFPRSTVFEPWKKKKLPCPNGGPLSVTLTDWPALKILPGRSDKRILEFRLTVNSHLGGKKCAQASQTTTAKQVLEIRDGVPVGEGSFTTP